MLFFSTLNTIEKYLHIVLDKRYRKRATKGKIAAALIIYFTGGPRSSENKLTKRQGGETYFSMQARVKLVA